MKWRLPAEPKIYEAITAVITGKVELTGENNAKVWSSSGNKFYTITFDPDIPAIMSNDNSSYWKGELGYPSIAYLMNRNLISYDSELAAGLAGIFWKDINQKHKNDFHLALQSVLADLDSEYCGTLEILVNKVMAELEHLGLEMLGNKMLPPKGY